MKVLLCVSLLAVCVSAATAADAPAQSAALSLDVLSTRITYTCEQKSSDTALRDIAQLARYPICIENRVDILKNPKDTWAHQVNVDAQNMRLGDVIQRILEQEPLFTVRIAPETATIHVIRKELVDDPDWLPNREVKPLKRTKTSLYEVGKSLWDELHTESEESSLLGLSAGSQRVRDLWDVQFAADFPGGTLRELLDHVALRMGRVGWCYGYSRYGPPDSSNKLYASLSVYPVTGLPWPDTWLLDTNQPSPFEDKPAE